MPSRRPLSLLLPKAPERSYADKLDRMVSHALSEKTVSATRIVWIAAGLVIGLTTLRVAGLFLTPLNLGPDEAQYWRWSQTLSWGYFSKPPLIAWLIAAVTNVFGDAEWAVRLPAPFLHGATAGLLFLLARDIYDARTGAYAAITYSLMPGIVLASGLMTTDALLMPLAALALLELWRLREAPQNWLYAILLGAAIGLGLLAKYAMLYVLIGIGLVVWLDTHTRRALMSLKGSTSAVIALFIVSPHLVWNADNAFQTVTHTIDNANWSGQLFHPENALTFLGDQMGVVGPVAFIALIAACLGTAVRRDITAPSIWLSCFILPPLLIIFVQAITSRAHANWAAVAYVAGCVLIARFLANGLSWPRYRWQIAAGIIFCASFLIPNMALVPRACIGIAFSLAALLFGRLNQWGSLGLFHANVTTNSIFALLFMILAVGPMSWSEQVGLADAFKRARAWPASVSELVSLAELHNAQAIMVDEREYWHGLDYYGRTEEIIRPLYMWQRNASPGSYAETFQLPSGTEGPILIAGKSQLLQDHIAADFKHIDRIGVLEIDLGGSSKRTFSLYLGYSHAPAPRGDIWNERFAKRKPID